jgi:hypothetical protein
VPGNLSTDANLFCNPGAGSAKGLYPLRELGSDIEALRFYEPIANTDF